MATEAQIFRYDKLSSDFDWGRKVTKLAVTDRICCQVQQIKEGGETRLHSHANLDGFWMVLSGKAKFYGDNDKLLGEFGRLEGVLIPRGFKYWFESSSEDEPLELLQVEASDIPVEQFFGGNGYVPKNIVESADGLVEKVPG